MNKQLLLPLLLLPYWVMAAQSTDVDFTTNPAEAQARAQLENKLYFVHFTAAWCMPCQWMEQHTFANDTLATFVNENYIAVKMDFDDPKAASYKQKYKVVSLPSMLIFNAKGELLDRYETSLSKDQLLRALKKNLAMLPRKGAGVAKQIAYTSPGNISRPALIPEEATVADKPLPPPAAPVTAATKTPLPKPVEVVNPLARYAVQIGVYSDYANAARSCDRIKQRFDQPVQIIESQQNGKNLYKVMVGKFEHKEEAERLLEQLKAKSIAGFVKNMNNF